MLPRCGRAAHICEANKTVWELQQKSKRELEESQLPSKQKVEMMEQGFRGNCDSQASWGCAPALPNRIRVVFLEQAAGSEIPVPHFWHTERVVRKATAFRGGANKTAPPCET